MKKLYLLLATTLLAAGLTGCGSSRSGAQTAQDLPAAKDTGSQPAPEIPASPVMPSPAGGYGTNCVTVNSSEKVTVVPDIAEIVYAVRTEAKEPSDCQQQNAAAVSQVTALLVSLDIAESSIQTSDFHMNPVYDYSNNRSRVVGYEAVTSLTVSDLPIDGLAQILSQSVSTGVNTVQSITYQASKYD